MTVVVRPEILTSLDAMREDVQRQVAGLDRYRALKAIEQTIADFPALQDVAQSLADIRDRVQRQLDETREYRALRTIERIMPELSDVLALLEEGAPRESNTAVADATDAPARDEERAPEPDAVTPAQPAPEVSASHEFEAVMLGEITESGAEPAVSGSQAYREETTPSEPLAEAAHEHHPPETEIETGPPFRPGAVPSLADSVAQLMAQSIAPLPREAHAPAQQPQERGDAALAHSERAA